jgi:hypothetical protein
VHYLHNASTTAGQAYLVSNLILLRALGAGADAHGHFLNHDRMTEEQRNWVCFTGAVMHAQLGTTSAKQMKLCTDVQEWECGPPEVIEEHDAPKVVTVFNAQDASGEICSELVTIGLSFVTEGIAYEVDREIRRLDGTCERKLDEHTKVFPYLAYRVLVRSWSGRDLSPNDYIAIGVCALTNNFAGFGLAEICRALKSTDLPLDQVLQQVRANWHGISSLVLSHLREQRRDLSKGDVIWTAMGEYLKLAEAGVQLRQNRWAPEFEFILKGWTPEQFTDAIGSMLDCLVIQSKPEGASELNWIGPGKIARTDEAMQCLGALQSALHFSQLHLSPEGVARPTAMLPSTECPFTGGCGVEHRDKFPSDCRLTPWKRFLSSPPGEKVCWYAAGVKALKHPTSEQQ